MAHVHMKGFCLQLVHAKDCWDFEIAAQMIDAYHLGKHKKHYMNLCRLWCIEASVGGVFQVVEEAVDDGFFFGEGKLLCKYCVTDFGKRRMAQSGLLSREE